MKKRLVAGILAGAMAMSLMAGCGSSSSSSAAADSAASGSAVKAADGEYNMTLLMSVRDEFLSSLEAAAMSCAKENGVNLTTQDCQNDASKQLQYIETAANNGEDAVLVNVVDAETGKECIEAAGDMACVFVNRSLSDNELIKDYKNAAIVASNEDETGGYVVENLDKHFADKGDEPINVVIICGVMGQYAVTHRTQSVKDAMKASKLNYVQVGEDLAGEWDRATAIDVISPLLGVEDIDAVLCNNDSMAIGVIEALNAAGLEPGKDVVVTGIDATVDGCQAVAEGTELCTVFQNPVGQGEGAILAALNIINGRPCNDGTDFETAEGNDQVMWVPFEPVNADNVADYQ